MQRPFGGDNAQSLIGQADAAINAWIAKLGVKLTGTVDALTISRKRYPDDGSIIVGPAVPDIDLEVAVGDVGDDAETDESAGLGGGAEEFAVYSSFGPS